jgi:signal transduction histidine kinase
VAQSLSSDFSEILPRHAALSRVMTKLFRLTTGLPAILYIASRDDVSADQVDWSRNFTGHCERMMELAPEKCQSCHKRRALRAIKSGSELSRCHAGLWNQAVPIVIDGAPQAVILYGQMRRESDTGTAEATAAVREKGLAQLNLIGQELNAIEVLYQSVAIVPETQLEALNAALAELADAITSEDERVQQSILRVIHDINTRMQAVMAHAENMQDTTLQPAEVRVMAKEVLNQTVALDATVQTLGDFMAEYAFEDAAIEPLLTRARDVYLAEANRLGIKIRLQLSNSPWQPLHLSKPHMQHALFNLVHNAVKYSFRAAAGADRFVQIESRHTSNGVTIVISNYGIGILPEEYDRIFQDGYQGKLTKDENRTGSGKGLSFVRSVIGAHGGTVSVDSIAKPSDRAQRPHVNRFTIFLPHADAK